MNGVLIIDKAAGMTSHDVVNRARRILKERSIGHLGTLDPMATGVLPLVVGRMTRLAQFYSASVKEYEGEIRFGFATTTYDAEGDRVGETVNVEVDAEQLRSATAKFQGIISQTPPPFSAKKIAGVPAYKLARKQQPVEIKPVEVEVHNFEILNIAGDRATFRSRVSSGTYIRSIAHDLGQALGCGAHLSALRRTAVCEFKVEDALTLECAQQLVDNETIEQRFVHPRKLLPEFPSVSATEEIAGKIRHGMQVNLPEMSQAKLVKVFRGQRELIAIASRIAGTLFHPKIVLS